MVRTIRNLFRLIGIARTLALYDALFPATWLPATSGLALAARALSGFQVRREVAGLRPGERLALALQALGPSFIKFGQMLSTRSDLVGEAIADDLSSLQDRLPPFSAAEARAAIEAEFEMPLADLFESFDDKPVAAASIAQVHFAVARPSALQRDRTPAGETAEGRPVAVKVLRPGIERAMARDIELFRWIATIVERTQPRLRRLRPVVTVETFAESVYWEMDLRMEGAAASELAENFADDPLYVVPPVDWERTGRRVLTTGRIDGIAIYEVDALVAAGHDLEAIVAKAAETFFLQVFRDGFFHADMHPGNAFVGADGALCVVDFGIMGRIDRKTRYFLADMLLGLLTGDYDQVADVHIRAGYVPAGTDRETFRQAIRAIAEPIFGLPTRDISVGRLLSQVFQVSERFRMETQPDLLLLEKTMIIAEGVGRRLAPDINMWQLAQPLIEDWMREHRGPEARLAEATADAIATVRALPEAVRALERAASRVADGTVRFEAVRSGQSPWPIWIALAVVAALALAALLG